MTAKMSPLYLQLRMKGEALPDMSDHAVSRELMDPAEAEAVLVGDIEIPRS